MSEAELRLECAKLAVAAAEAGFTGDFSKIFEEIWAKLS